jgi:hypothetical protein
MNPHEKQPGGVVTLDVAELLRIDDVAAGSVGQARYGWTTLRRR